MREGAPTQAEETGDERALEIERLKTEIEELNRTVQESGAMAQFGKEHGFDKNATYDFIEKKVSENENSIRNLEKGIQQEAAQGDINRVKSEIDELNKTVQESEAMEKFGREHGFDKEATYSFIENRIAENEAKIHELEGGSTKVEQVEDKTEEIKEEKDTESSKQEVIDEINAAIDGYPVENMPEGDLVSHGNFLINEMDWARKNNKPELVQKLNERLQQVKQRVASLEAGETLEDKEEADPEVLEKKAEEESAEKTPEVPQTPEEIEAEQDKVVDELLPYATPEVKQAAKEAIKKSLKEKIMGIQYKEILKNMATGAVVGVAAKAALRGVFGGLTLGIVGGATSALIRKEGFAKLERVRHDRAEKAVKAGKAEEIIGRVEKGWKMGLFKLNKLDALKVLEEARVELEKAKISDERYQTVINTYQKLTENKEGLGKLKGFDRLQEYIKIAETVEKDSPELEKRRKELADITGRHIPMGQLIKAMAAGAIGGAVGYGVAHYLGGAFGHHTDVPTKGGGLYPHNTHFDKPNFEGPVTAEQEGSLNNLLYPHEHASTAEVHQFGYVDKDAIVEAPEVTPDAGVDASGAHESVGEVKVKGTVWGTLKSLFKSRGVNLNNDQLNTITRGIAAENHIGIAADHPVDGSYNVLDTKIPDGTVLHGVDKFMDLGNLPHASADLPQIPHIEIAHIYSSDELSQALGVDNIEYSMVHPDSVTVGEAYNWVAAMDASPAQVHTILAIDNLEPSGEEINMTIQEFMQHRLSAAAESATPHIEHAVHATHAGISHGAHNVVPTELPHLEGGNIAAAMQEVGVSPDAVPEGPDFSHLSLDDLKPGLTPSHPTVEFPSDIHAASLTPEVFHVEASPHTKGENNMMEWLVGAGVVTGAAGAIGLAKYAERNSKNVAAEKTLLEDADTPEKAEKLEPEMRLKKVMSMLNPRNDSEIHLTKKQRAERLTAKEAKKVEGLIKKEKFGDLQTTLRDIWKGSVPEKREQIEKAVEFIGKLGKDGARTAAELFRANVKAERDQEALAANPTT